MMKTTRFFKSALVCAAVMSAMAFTSCDKGGSENSENSELVGKWMAEENALGIVSVEFAKGGNYIVVSERSLLARAEEEPMVYLGTYRVDGDEVAFSDLGTITVNSLSGGLISFTVNDTALGDVAVGATKAPTVASSTKTDQLCRTWKLINYESNDPDDEGFNPEGMMYVYFSDAGTYLMTNPAANESGLSNWKWKSEASGVFYYSWDTPPVWSEDEIATVETLTDSRLVVSERDVYDYNGDGVDETYEYRMTFEPVSTFSTRADGSSVVSFLKETSGRETLKAVMLSNAKDFVPYRNFLLRSGRQQTK